MVTLAAGSSAKIFMNKRFYLHIKGKANTLRAAELIKAFGGQIDEFLECGVSYVLTDVLKAEWPDRLPKGCDETLRRALESGVKLMSFHDLLKWCSRYLASPSSSDEDEEIKAQINRLQAPFIKFEPLRGNFAPVARELRSLPEPNLAPKMGTSIFLDPNPQTSTPTVSLNTTTTANHLPHNNSAQLTPQAISSRMTPITITPFKSINIKSQVASPLINFTPNSANAVITQLKQQHQNHSSGPPMRQHKRRHPAYCEICNQRPTVSIEEHCQSTSHLENLKKLDWTDVHSVISSLPRMETLTNLGRDCTLQLTAPTKNFEFVPLHKMGSVESVSQLFHAIN